MVPPESEAQTEHGAERGALPWLNRAILGRRLASRETEGRKIGWFEAVPAMGLDGLGSSSYGPEAALSVMIPLGAAGLGYVGPIMALIVALLAILYLSYRQTVVAYPSNGGAYVVARENLGTRASLLAATAIMVDYVLNVAVGVSAGVGALTSSVPSLQPYTLALCLAVLALVALANLRGTSEAGWLFSLPTYLFIASFLGLLAVGIGRLASSSGGHPHPVVAPPSLAKSARGADLWILIRAFAAGCTAMTGVEAVSNAVGAFKAPVPRQAHMTLTVICAVLGLLLVGVALLANGYGLGAMDQTKAGYQSLMSQMTAAVAGRGRLYYVAMASLLAVLCLSANTSYVGFPRVCKMVAQDGFLPRSFSIADRRLVYSVGIGFLTLSAGGLLILFGGITDKLIPLFAIGAFLTFTFSQVGMVVHWRRQAKAGGRDAKGAHVRLGVNALGAAATTLALMVIVAAKFVEGAWIVIVAIPLIYGLLRAIGRYYEALDARLQARGAFDLDERAPPTILVAVEGRSRMTDRALQFAMTLSPDVIAVHLLRLEGPDSEDDGRRLKAEWAEQVLAPLAACGVPAPRLMLLPAPFRRIHEPLLELIERLDAETPGRSVAVLIPELVLGRWWERLLHPRHADSLRRALLAHGGPRLNVITAPWRC